MLLTFLGIWLLVFLVSLLAIHDGLLPKKYITYIILLPITIILYILFGFIWFARKIFYQFDWKQT